MKKSKTRTTMEAKKFTRVKEDFNCEHCRQFIAGDGYTNHCPHCLWSKHVDVNPGDRAAQCHGLMEPISVESRGTEYTILHRCTICGHEKKNKSAEEDNVDVLLTYAGPRM